MSANKKIYSLVVVIFTVISVAIMINTGGNSNYADQEYMSSLHDYRSEEDIKYSGYIFDDYNENVNLNYTDKVTPNPGDKDVISTVSISSMGMEYTSDNARAIRSERLMEERALKEEILNQQ